MTDNKKTPSRKNKTAHALRVRSCDASCDGDTWTNEDHKLLVDTLDSLHDQIRERDKDTERGQGLTLLELHRRGDFDELAN